MAIEFDEIPTGGWLRGRDLVGHWVLFMVTSIARTEGIYGEQSIATVDFIDLSEESPEIQYSLRLSDPYIVDKLRTKVGKNVVGYVNRGEPKKKGFQGAIFLEQPKNPGYEAAVKKAKKILEGGETPPPPPTDELEDLLA